MTSRNLHLARLGIATAITAGMLAACGGGDDENTSSSVPASASESSASFISYLRGLATNETDEPLSLDGFLAPVDDSSDSTPLS